MKIGIGYLCIGVAFSIAVLWNDGIAEAGLLDSSAELKVTVGNGLPDGSGTFDLIAGITSLTEEVPGNLDNVSGIAGNLLQQTVETTVQTSGNLLLETVAGTSGDVLGSVTKVAGSAVNDTADIIEEVGVTATDAITAAVGIVLVPPSSDEPVPESVPEENGVDEDDFHTTPDAGIREEPNLAGAETIRKEDLATVAPLTDAVTIRKEDPVTIVAPLTDAVTIRKEDPATVAPATKDVQKEKRITLIVPVPCVQHVAQDHVDLISAKNPLQPANHSSSQKNYTNNVPVTVTNTQTQSTPGHGGYPHLKQSDAIIAEKISLRLSGRHNYAKNTEQLITKRGNEPPTPPPKYSFFSDAYEPMRKRSVAIEEKNRKSKR